MDAPRDEHEGVPGPDVWSRRSTRRALLAGGATVAALGAAGAVLGASRLTSGGGNDTETGGGEANEPRDGAAPAAALKTPIEDPRRRAAHLLRRAGFGGTRAEIESFAALSREEAADRLLDYESIDNSALDARIATASFNLTTPYQEGQRMPRLQIDMQRWWLTRMAYTARPLEERMTYIWHGLLTTQVSKIGPLRSMLMVRQNELFRRHALGRYDDLLHAIGKDPAMMIYLDTEESTKEHPNENYARELMELFSMGVGNYTEDDVRESARAFTGWRVVHPRPIDGAGLTPAEQQARMAEAYGAWEPQFTVRQGQHDYGTKTFLGETGPWDGDDIVDIIMNQPATGRFVCRRLFTELANYNPDDETIEQLVGVWDTSGHSIREVVRAILVSDEFNSETSYRCLVRSPVELVVNLVRALEIETDFPAPMLNVARAMDQVLFEPPSVAGWPGGATWLSSSTFFARVNFLDAVFFSRQRVRPTALPTTRTPEETVDAALERLIDDNLSAEARETLYAFARSVPNAEERAAAIAYLVAASPEYQLV